MTSNISYSSLPVASYARRREQSPQPCSRDLASASPTVVYTVPKVLPPQTVCGGSFPPSSPPASRRSPYRVPSSKDRPADKVPLAAPSCPDAPGRYVIIHEGTLVRSTISMIGSDEEMLGTLKEGTVVEVVEVRTVVAEGRVRGRITEPAGWISLRDLESNETPWALAMSVVVGTSALEVPVVVADPSTRPKLALVDNNTELSRINGYRSPGLPRVGGVVSQPPLRLRNASSMSEMWEDDVGEEQLKALERLKAAVKTIRPRR